MPVLSPEEIRRQRRVVRREAYLWLNTPFQHIQAKSGVGVDCAHVGETYKSALGVAFTIPEGYSPQWHLHEVKGADGKMAIPELYLDNMDACGFVEIKPEQRDMGDVVMSKIGRVFCHAGIIDQWPYVIQAESAPNGAGKVIRANAEANWFLSQRVLKFFSRKEWHDA